MINVEFSYLEDDIILTIDGHAEYSKGNDIVCAGVSAIAYNLASYLQYNQIPFTFKDNPGDFLCGVKRSELATESMRLEDVKPYYDFVYIGLYQIQRAYPKNVTMKINK